MKVVAEIRIGKFTVADAKPPEIARAAVEAWTASESPVVLTALHVGGLLLERNAAYVAALERSDLVYADGASVVLLAKAAGARSIARCPTTDFGHQLLLELSRRLGRPPAVALVGGPPGLAERAGRQLERTHGTKVVLAADGFPACWDDVVAVLLGRKPEVLLLGLGTELEAEWTSAHASRLGHTLVVTCGGWFGFLAGDEQRAPSWMRKLQLEWLHRLWLAPIRLGPRYSRGFLRVLSMMIRAWRPQAVRHAPKA